MRIKMLFAVLALTCAGCGSAFTSIRQLEDGSYLVTANSAGFIRMSGHVYRCTGDDKKLVCQETGGE